MRSRLVRYCQLMVQHLSGTVTPEQSRKLHDELTGDAAWNLNYGVLLVSSCAIATFGLIADSAAVIIGAMLIAPLMLPLRALAFAALEGDVKLLRRAFVSIFGGTLIAIVFSGLVGLILPIPSFGAEFQARVKPSLVDLGIAIAAGTISGFAKIRTEVSDVLAGTAIAVALMPPLCVVGLALSRTFSTPGFFTFSQQALLLYLTNLAGITLACMLVFILAGYTKATHSVVWATISVLVLLVPLGANFITQIRQAQIEELIRTLLVRNTLTIGQQDVTLVDSRINWRTEPPQVYLNVQVATDVSEEISPKQVGQVQQFLSQKVGQPLKLVIFISRGRTVTEDGINRPQAKTTAPLIDPSKPLLPDPAPQKKLQERLRQEAAQTESEKSIDEAMPTTESTREAK